ncbi:glycosyltransferase involved in cell wall biosynthesis [Povalibacter uvarum]|uniref:Glycosyltransferase involved in cell wall biosynthesis n=1 Tax=Povalibacter uvarum TaxID=732238 RepID=A0A841HRS4_9GAMM|nr:glycosyltransferase family 2 protein [Povalibacter uvarum]MBB6094920.1 glycosyltransferase involved in cell wall biosynthesis [Povalibacter uvarum]
MRKLIIQIPCYNEEGTLGLTLDALPRSVAGFDVVERLIIDDGSKDDTVKVARQHGVEHIVSLSSNQGLARAFLAGLEAALKAGADVIVNTDADNQYDAAGIDDLVRPILAGQAQIVIGARPISAITEFSPLKKMLQRLGSAVVKIASDTEIPDAPSGFRAIHRDAALRLNVFNNYTYTLETIIQAGRKGIAITSVPIRVNGATRPSRLVKSMSSYVRRSIFTIVRIFVLYKPLRFFMWVGSLFLIPGVLVGARFLWKYLQGQGDGHVQSLILSSILIVTAMVVFGAGIVADLVAANRVLLEEVRMRLLKAEIVSGSHDASRPCE